MFGPKFACLVFSDTSLKIATAKPAGKGVKVSYLAQKSLPEGAVLNGRIADTNLFKEALKTFFLENYERLRTRHLVLGLNEQDVFPYCVSFVEKPKNLRQAIEEKIAPKNPFDLAKACLIYRENSSRIYQVATAEAIILEQLTTVFADIGFSIEAIVPLPLAFPKLIGRRETPYLFVSEEEDLTYCLVVNNTVAFSSTEKLKQAVAESEKEIIKIAREILDKEYNASSNQPLKDVFVAGKDAETIKGFFGNQGFDALVANPPSQTSKQVQGASVDFSRCLALAFYDSDVLSFPKLDVHKPTESAQPPRLTKVGRKSRQKYFIFLLVLLAAIALFFCWPTVRNFLFKGSAPAEPTNVATTSSSPKQKEATTSSGRHTATPSAQPAGSFNKADFKIQVLNGTGKVGAATKMRDFLTAHGYNVTSVGNAATFNHQTTTLQIKQSKNAITDILTKDLAESYAINVGSPLNEGESFDILIVVGGD